MTFRDVAKEAFRRIGYAHLKIEDMCDALASPTATIDAHTKVIRKGKEETAIKLFVRYLKKGNMADIDSIILLFDKTIITNQ